MVESDYGIALEKELKEARVVTKKNIEATHDIRRVNMIEKSRTINKGEVVRQRLIVRQEERESHMSSPP